MPDIQLIKLGIRRGTDTQRQSVVLEQGEFGYTTDYRRLWVGDGVTSGGNVMGTYNHAPLATLSGRTTLTNAVRGDLVFENSLLWQLTGTNYAVLSSWGNISNRADERYITFNASNQLTLSANSLGGDRFAPGAATGGIVATRTNGLSANVDDLTIAISANKFIVKTNSLDEYYLKTTTFTRGINGGNGTKVGLDVNNSLFGFIAGTTLTLSALPANVVGYTSINSTLIGDGLTLDGTSQTIKANLSGVNATLTNTSGVIGLASVTTADSQALATVTKDIYGRVTSTQSSVVARLSSNDTTAGNYNILSAFNGYPGQVSQGRISGLPLTTISVLSANNTAQVTISLSSAGFITLPSLLSQDGRVIDRVAVPVFTF